MKRYLILVCTTLAFAGWWSNLKKKAEGVVHAIEDKATDLKNDVFGTTKKAAEDLVTLPIGAVKTSVAWGLRESLNSKNPYRRCAAERTHRCPNDSVLGFIEVPLIGEIQLRNSLLRQGNDLSQAEYSYVINSSSNRGSITQLNLKNNFPELNLQRPLRIAFCGSGGGDRAMLSTLGFMIGAQTPGTNVLDCTSFFSALSGSTWAVGLWLSSGKTLGELKANLKHNLSKPTLRLNDGLSSIPPITDKNEIARLLKNLVTKSVFEQDISVIDIWGGLIANHVLKNSIPAPLSTRMTRTQIPRIQGGDYPLPIYTAVSGNLADDYHWWEFTPFECGSVNVGYWCPTWAFGREFNRGESVRFRTPKSPVKGTEYAPEQTLGLFLGACGSAITVNLGEVIQLLKGNTNELSPDEKTVAIKALEFIEKSNVGKIGIPSAKVSNFTYKLDGSPIKENRHVELRDAGVHYNLPITPLMRKERRVDIIFIFDASGDILEAPAGELKKAATHFRKMGAQFHDLSQYPNLGKESITILSDCPECPICVYMPLVKDPNIRYDFAANFDLESCFKRDCSTFNFNYNETEFDGITNLTQENFTKNKDKIIQALKIASNRAG